MFSSALSCKFYQCFYTFWAYILSYLPISYRSSLFPVFGCSVNTCRFSLCCLWCLVLNWALYFEISFPQIFIRGFLSLTSQKIILQCCWCIFGRFFVFMIVFLLSINPLFLPASCVSQQNNRSFCRGLQRQCIVPPLGAMLPWREAKQISRFWRKVQWIMRLQLQRTTQGWRNGSL